jgi:hypothetical protein
MAFGSLMPPLFTSRLRYEAHPFLHLADAATVLPMAFSQFLRFDYLLAGATSGIENIE